ncbi:phage tail protein [Pseudomonas lundensis]|uniref:phage tail protein n=1 Tax=Serratia proteamaculans TaxID=28151 RepID=UPI00298250A5|nr:phage tail protein [Serratia proteamaculans]MDW5501377.1 phage tail protein [Serratia proteamaculans]MDW5506442.1 phage tail protein [Pseudomonas lundensis]
MTAKYRALLTDQGKALLANAAATGQKLEITQMAVGDGGGAATLPSESQTTLVNEKRRAVLNSLLVNANSSNQVIAEQVIPEDTGGWWIRELGLYDKNGVLVAVANTPDTYKPLLAEGAGRTQVVRMVLLVKGDANAVIVADKTAVLVSRDTLDAAITEHARSRNHPDATLLAKGFTQLSSDSNNSSETLAATPKAVKAVNDASVKKSNNLSDLTNKAVARGNLALGNAATRNVGTEATNLMEVGAFGLGAGPIHRTDTYSNRGEIYRVNSTSKSAPGGGVYGVLNLPCDGGPSSGYLAVQSNGTAYIGNSTTPEKPLAWSRIYTTGFKPTAADVGAYSKSEADGKFVKQSGDTITGSLTVNGAIETKSGLTTPSLSVNGNSVISGQLTAKAGIELFGGSPFIDFHYGNTNTDYDVRIINENPGKLTLGAKIVRVNENLSVGVDAYIDRKLYVTGECRAGDTLFSGGAAYQTDGNINGSIWDGYLNVYLNQNFVRDIRLGNVEYTSSWNAAGYLDTAGYVLTGAANNNKDEYIDIIYRRPLQKNINGNWVTVWSV